MILETLTDEKIDYAKEIEKLRKEMNAVILAHYYQVSEIQDIADYVGDSLELARRAKETDADVIVFCGVHFMAETAKILNPEKLVLLPDMEAGCSLADSAPAPLFKEFREKHPDHFAVTYINCSTGVKALSDVIVTSSNAEHIINQIPAEKPILFSPDRNLGKFLMKKTGRDMLLWEGTCLVHETFSEQKILDLMAQHPDAKLVAHPECEDAVLRHADFVGSTGKLLKYVKQDEAHSYIVATESGILHQMKKDVPGKNLIAAPPQDDACSCSDCPYMKLNTMEKLYRAMRDREPEIILEENLRQQALIPLERMLEMSK